ncbi:MAG: DedA family protein [Thermacetogeniaceae bacterium]|jgi:membrane protein DedA with SNARE-associated domain|nr:DedA family protein [Thermoanaerobacterales bacterium]
MEDFIIDIINRFGYLGVFLLIIIENFFPPIPSEIILTFGGFMTTCSRMTVWGVIISATIGSSLGAVVLYILGRILNGDRLELLFDSKFGKMLHLKVEDVRTAGKWFNKHGYQAVFLCRFVPIVRSLISIPAGMAKMRLDTFLLLTILGTFIWNAVLVYLGSLAGEAWGIIASYMDYYTMITAAVLVILVLVFAVYFIKKRFIGH